MSRFLLLAALCAAPSLAITPVDLSTRLARNERILLVDVRSATAYAEGHIPGAINIPLGLLPHKPVPSAELVIIYGDGLGVVDDTQALTTLRAKPAVTADALEGGYAAWLAETRISTAVGGVTREKLPGITYQQLIAAGKKDMVLVDLRAAALAPLATTSAKADRPAVAASVRDVVGEFGGKLGVPVVAPHRAATGSMSVAGGATPARAAAPVQSLAQPGNLLVLVADNEAEANEAARHLRASGHYRFTVLIGGTEIIRHEGRQGTGRMDGGVPVNEPKS